MIDKQYFKNELKIIKGIEDSQECKSLIKHGKVNQAQKTGQRYQIITEEDAEIIMDNLDELYRIYASMTNASLSLQADVVNIKNRFQKSIRGVYDDED